MATQWKEQQRPGIYVSCIISFLAQPRDDFIPKHWISPLSGEYDGAGMRGEEEVACYDNGHLA